MKKILSLKYAILFLILGLGIFFYPFFTSNFEALAGDYIDSRYIAYLLEHFWLYVQQIAPHQALWSPPMYYPSTNALATSDCLFGLGLIYVPLRFLFDSYNSFMLTVIALCTLNFASFYYLLKKYFKFNDLACAFGSFIFTFCLFRQEQLRHVQIFSQFLSVFAVIFFLKSKDKKWFSFIGTIFLALQLYTSFYLGWLFFFALGLTLIIFLCFKDYRAQLFSFIKNYYKIILSNLVFYAILIAPLAYHYLQNEVLKFPFEVVKMFQTTILNGILNNSFLDNLIFFKLEGFSENTYYGLGIFTTLFLIYGLIKLKTYRRYCIAIILCVLSIMNFIFIEKIIYDYVIGGGAIRALVRYFNILIPIFAIISAYTIQNLNKNVIKWLIIILIAVEQISVFPLFEWTKTGAENIINSYNVPKTCNVIFIDYSKIPTSSNIELDKYEVDGMWVALRNKIYTVHGYGASMQPRKQTKLQPECILELK